MPIPEPVADALTGRDIWDRLSSLTCGANRCPCYRTARTGRGLTHCPSHGPDRKPSLSVRFTADGTFLAHCFTGCDQVVLWRALFGNLRLSDTPARWEIDEPAIKSLELPLIPTSVVR